MPNTILGQAETTITIATKLAQYINENMTKTTQQHQVSLWRKDLTTYTISYSMKVKRFYEIEEISMKVYESL
jgi:hypothetical protein